MNSFGSSIKKYREEQKLPLRSIAAYLNMDQAVLSKIENGHRRASRKQVVELAKYFKVNEDDLLVEWLSDKLVYEVGNEDIAYRALKVAEEKVAYIKLKKTQPSVGSSLKNE